MLHQQIGTGLDRDATRRLQKRCSLEDLNRKDTTHGAEGVLLTPFVYGIGQGCKIFR